MNEQIQATIIDAVNIMYQLNLAGQDVYLTNGQLSIALSLPDELLSNEVKKFVTLSKNRWDRQLELEIEASNEATRTLTDLDKARESAEKSANELRYANEKLQQTIARRDADIAKAKQDLEHIEGYTLQKERQEKQFTFITWESVRVYAFVGALLGVFVYTGSESVMNILSLIAGVIISAYSQQIGATFAAKEKEERRTERAAL